MYRFFRPWGFYEDHFEEDGYKLKRLIVNPNSKLSLQYHYKRCEHWVCVQGYGKIILGEDTLKAYPGKYFYIPTKVNHRIMAGEEGAEYVNIEPTQNEGAGMGGGGQIIFQGNVLSKDFIEDEAIPMIRDAVRRGHTLA